MDKALIHKDVDEYLRSRLTVKAAAFMLQKHPFEHLSNLELTQQLVGLQKARNKFPSLFENNQILYPPKVNLEQTSSEETAWYKSQILEIDSMIDLTGGFGIDVSAFAKANVATTHVELSDTLQAYAAHSFEVQKLHTKTFCRDGISLLKTVDAAYDLIYLDPSRKTTAISKAILLEDYEPNVLEHLDLLFEKSNKIMVKTSPMLDITAGMRQLRGVDSVHIVAVKNEVKELLWILDASCQQSPQIYCINLLTDQPRFETSWNSSSTMNYSSPQKYLYEPNAAIMKSQQFEALMEQYTIHKLDQDAHLFTSNEKIEFPGRVFEVQNVFKNKPKLIKRYYAKSARAVVTRNHKESVAQLRKKYQFSEHETDYLFFTSAQELGGIVVEAIKIS